MGESRTNADMVRKAIIHVTTRANSTVKFVKGSTTMATLTADSSGVCNYEVRYPNFGSWTINVTNGYDSGSSTVNVVNNIQYNVSVWITKYIYKDGVWTSFAAARGVYASATSTYSEADTYFQISKINSNVCYLYVNNIDVTGATSIQADVQTFNVGLYYPNYRVKLSGATSGDINITQWTTRGLATFDVSNVSGNVNIEVGHYVYGDTASSGYMRCYNIEVL